LKHPTASVLPQTVGPLAIMADARSALLLPEIV
jgi:hypothetical protein